MQATEFADFQIKPGHESAFENAARQAIPIFQTAYGCRSMSIFRLIERPNTYRLVIIWETLEDHTITFRDSPGFLEWRELVGPHFAAPPIVEHGTITVVGHHVVGHHTA